MANPPELRLPLGPTLVEDPEGGFRREPGNRITNQMRPIRSPGPMQPSDVFVRKTEKVERMDRLHINPARIAVVKAKPGHHPVSRLIRSIPRTVVLSILLAGYAAAASPTASPDSSAKNPSPPTRLGAAFSAGERIHRGQSGFRLLDYGLEALLARAAFADSADRTIDAQFYIFDHDEAGELLLRRLISAADRGVRVRLLVDDFNFKARSDLVALCSHPLIQIRVFNPVSHRWPWSRLLGYLVHFREADRRMHDKVFIVDNEVAIIGGRNVGNDYFNIAATKPFRDFDVLAAGPIVAQASTAFERFWSSSWSVPLPAVFGRRSSPSDLKRLRQKLAEPRLRSEPFEAKYRVTRDRYLSAFVHDGNALIWASGEIVSDFPEKMEEPAPASSLVARRFAQECDRAQNEILVEQAYFLPGTGGPVTFSAIRRTKAKVRILTCGADTTDVPIVYGAYRRTRIRLLEAGVELHEFRKQRPRKSFDQEWYQVRPSYADLHSKVIVFDRRIAWIGTFNLDPRSVHLNTEIVVIIQSERFARQMAEAINADFSPERSWRVHFVDGHEEDHPSRERIVLTGDAGGRQVTLRGDPASIWRNFEIFMLSLIPGIQSQL